MKLLCIFSSKQNEKIAPRLSIQIEVVFISNSICTFVEHSVEIYKGLGSPTNPAKPPTIQSLEQLKYRWLMDVFYLGRKKWLLAFRGKSIWRLFLLISLWLQGAIFCHRGQQLFVIVIKLTERINLILFRNKNCAVSFVGALDSD